MANSGLVQAFIGSELLASGKRTRIMEVLSDGRFKVCTEDVQIVNGRPENIFIAVPFTQYRLELENEQ